MSLHVAVRREDEPELCLQAKLDGRPPRVLGGELLHQIIQERKAERLLEIERLGHEWGLSNAAAEERALVEGLE